MTYSYHMQYAARLDNAVVTVPDQIADNQESAAENDVVFPALYQGDEVMVRVDAEATGLFTPGVGDLVVVAV